MLNPCICGTFHDEDDDPLLSSPNSPRKSKRKYSRDDNPYSTRGLDRFSALLADLDERRQKIYSQMRPRDISFVRFVYSNTDDVVPIVVKKKNKDQKKHKSEELRVVKARNLSPISESMEKYSATESSNAITTIEERKQITKLEPEADQTKANSKKSFSWNMKNWDMWKPSFYVPMVMILILVFLTMFGKSVATLCTCVLWYIIPTLKDRSSNPRMSMKKKDYVRGFSEKKVVMTTEGTNKKKDYVRGFSEKKMVVNEGMKKKDYVRGWSEKKMDTEGLVSITSGSPEASNNKSTTAKHGHKKSW